MYLQTTTLLLATALLTACAEEGEPAASPRTCWLLLAAEHSGARERGTGSGVSVYNGGSEGIWVRGNLGQRWVPPHAWSHDAHPDLEVVDELDVPYGCDLTYQGHTYHYGDTIRLRGRRYAWIYGELPGTVVSN
jgi:hypothetical protein